MTMTHYMELLATNQPWNLILFMAIPVILAETITVTELYILFTRQNNILATKINKISSIIVGIYFLGVFIYLMKNAFIPITLTGSWRGPADFIAVSSYLLGIIPLVGMALLEMGIIGKKKNQNEKLKLHAILVAIFLVVAHIAMIAGMLNPEVLGYSNHVVMNMTITK
ncbi:MAG: DUF6803 family protein [Candidatus Nomurabacteria bacterium]